MELTAYCLKTKQKNVPFVGKPELAKTSRGGYMLKGVDVDGNKMSAIVSKDKAEEAIRLGLVTQA